MTVSRVWARRALFIGLVAVAGAGTPALAQDAPTPEGTTITNTATVSYTDVNGNAYADVSASVELTVGFQAGVDVTGGATATPAPDTDGLAMTFTIGNVGNGTDQFALSETNTNAAVMDVTGYTYGGTTYGTLAELNAVLAGVDVLAGNTIEVAVTYDVPAGTGGESASYTLTASSVRDAGAGDTSDAAAGTVSPTLTVGVTVTPDGEGGNVERLPSNGTGYSATFTVTNVSTGTETFDLAAPGGTVVTVSGITVDGGSATEIELAAGASSDVEVGYTVAAGAAGATEDLTLTATSQSDGTVSDAGHITVERVQAALAIAKTAWAWSGGVRGADISDGEILPGDFIEYEITVTNDGSSDARSVEVTDEVDARYLTFVTATDESAAWASITDADGTSGGTPVTVVTATLDGPLAAGASATFYVRVQVK